MSEFHNPVDVRFGVGLFETELPGEFDVPGITIVTSRGTRRRVLDDLIAKHDLCPLAVLDGCIENPTFESCAALYREIDFDRTRQILAVGGGSVLDAAKAVSLCPESHGPANGASRSYDAVESAIRVGDDLDSFRFLPLIAVPTTAGTGSEVTCWGSLWDNHELKKYSISHPRLYPARAYCDPVLTLSMPLETTLATALDALSHAFESIWNRNATDTTRSYALEAIELVLTHLVPLSRDLQNLELRTHLMRAALRAGLAFSNTKTSVAHALSYYLTLRKGVPHGRACSFSLPHILKGYLLEQPAAAHAPGGSGLTSDHLVRLNRMLDELGISTRPADYGVSAAEFDDFFRAGTQSERMQNSSIGLEHLRAELEATF